MISKLIQEVFNSESGFIAALDKLCAKFINDNAVTQAAGSTMKSAELLARYCDGLMRKGSKAFEEVDLEEKFNQIMIVFNYIEDKDVFLKFYQKLLAKRVVGQLSISDDYEGLMISKLKLACDCEYTSKLKQMFQDIGISKSMIADYENYCKNCQLTGISLVDFSVMVLTSNSWPFSIPPTLVLPIELKFIFDSFTDFYTHVHNGQVSWTVEQIQDETQMKSELLVQILYSLLKSKILLCAEINKDFAEVPIKMNYTIQLATDFRSDKVRINLHVPLKSIEHKDVKDFDEERKMMIQAAIARIMKARQTLKHALLMQRIAKNKRR